MTPNNLALVLLRTAGTLAVFFGGFELIAAPVIFVAGAGVLKDFEAVLDGSAFSFLSSGVFYTVVGVFLLSSSRRLAHFVSKFCTP